MSSTLFQLVQIVYWVALSTWFGSVLFIALAAPVILATVRRFDPTLPTVLSVNMEKQHGVLLGGSIVADLATVLVRVQLGCAGAVLLALLGQWLVADATGDRLLPIALRSAAFIAAVAIVLYQSRVVWPRVRATMDQYVEHADEPDVANPALDEFNRYQNESVTLMRNVSFLLLGMILFSTDIRPRPTFAPARSADAVTTSK